MATTLSFRSFKVFLFILLIISGDQLIGRILNYMYFNASSGKYAKLNYIINKSSEDILIFGNSHAECHYIPSILRDSLHLGCYNAGFRSNDILFTSAIHESILNRYSPKLVIFNIDKGMLYATQADFASYEAKLSDLLPFCNTKPLIKKEVEYRSEYEKYKLLSCIYPYNSSVINLLKYFATKDDSFIDGYYPIHGTYMPSSQNVNNQILNDKRSNKINKILVTKLIELLHHFRSHNTQIIAIVSPSFQSSDKFDSILSSIFIRQGIPFLDYSCDTNFINKVSFFSDSHHLNDKGAHFFTSMVAHDIKPILTKVN
jgi:hypothetical protein